MKHMWYRDETIEVRMLGSPGPMRRIRWLVKDHGAMVLEEIIIGIGLVAFIILPIALAWVALGDE